LAAELRATAQEPDMRELLLDPETTDHPWIALELHGDNEYRVAASAPARVAIPTGVDSGAVSPQPDGFSGWVQLTVLQSVAP
jgi:hypothetical protein